MYLPVVLSVLIGKKDMYTAFNTQTEGVKYLVLINCGATIGMPDQDSPPFPYLHFSVLS
jgi:hypothetical protein